MSRRGLDDDTHMGIDFVKYGLYVSIVMNVLFGIFFLSWSYNPRGDPTELACFLGLFALAAGILFLVGIYKLYKGRESVSFEHEKKVKTAVVLIIIGFFFGMLSPSLDGGSLDTLRSSMIIGGGADLIQQIGYAVALILLIYEIAGEKARKYLYLGASLLIIGSFSRLAWGIFFIPQEGEILDVLLTTLRMLSILMLLLAVGYLFMSIGYTKTAKSPEGISKTRSKAISSKEKCPSCGSKEFKRYQDGSGYCEYCGKTLRSNEGTKS